MSKFKVGDKVIVNDIYGLPNTPHGVGTVHEIAEFDPCGDICTTDGYVYEEGHLDPYPATEETWVKFEKTDHAWGAEVTAENIFEIAQELSQNMLLAVSVDFNHDGLVLVVDDHPFEVGEYVSNEGRTLNQGIWDRV